VTGVCDRCENVSNFLRAENLTRRLLATEVGLCSME
jgi:hypothetical protein